MNLVPQFGFFELLLIAVVALIVVGPKDLPKLMRSAGQFFAKAKAMAGEFTAAFDQMARETEMEELRKEIETLKHDNVFAKTKREMDESLAPVRDEVNSQARAIKEAGGTHGPESAADGDHRAPREDQNDNAGAAQKDATSS